MTVSATFELDPLTIAFQGWLQTAIRTPAGPFSTLLVTDSQAPLDSQGRPVPPPYVVLFQQPGQRPVTAWAGATTLTARWIATSVGQTPSQTRTLADRVRTAVAGEDLDGQHVTAMALPGVHVVRRATLDDGALDLAGGLWQLPETLELELAPG